MAETCTAPSDPGDLNALAHLLNEVFPVAPAYTPSLLHWHYLENPEGPAAVGRVLEAGVPVGNYALIPQRLRDDRGDELRIGVGVDLAVAPQARGSGAFRRTVEDAYRRGSATGLDAILGVANANSAPRMVSALGWRSLEALPVTLCLPLGSSRSIDSRPATPALLASGWFRSVGGPALVTNLGPGQGYAPVWDARRLAWRLSRPDRAYVLHASRRHLAVSTSAIAHRVRVGVVLKVLAREPGAAPLASARLATAVARAHRSPLVVHWGRNPDLATCGPRLPRALMPSPLALVSHSLGGRPGAGVFRLGAFELLDFDAF